MKKTRLIILLAMLMSIVRLNAVTYTYNGINYDLDESKCTASVISNSYSGDIVIPSTFMKSSTTYTVKSISRNAFKNCTNLNSVTIANSVTTIEDFAFQGCSLSSIVIPDNVTIIGYNAFRNCTSLTTVSFGNSLITIDEGAFMGCIALTSISLPNSLNTIGRWAFYGCRELANVNIPRNVISIGGGAFSRCLSITVDSNNKKYDSRNNCNAVVETASNTLIAGCQNTIITNGITSIGNYAFDGCIGINNMTIPSNVTTIGISAFEGCNGLTSFTIPGTVNTIGMNAFLNCTNLASVTIENGVSTIGQYAFHGCSSLTNVRINITTPPYLSTATFSNCSNATLYVPSGCKSAYEAADNWKDFSEIVEISPIINFADANVKTICVTNWDTNGDGELSEAEAAAVTEIGMVFRSRGIISFNEFQYFTGVTSIGERAFYYCANLASITIPNSVTSIGTWAFQGCSGLTSLTIPNSVVSIGTYAFYDSGLTSLDIPQSVVSIGNYAFSDCDLNSITVANGNTVYDSRENCNAIIQKSTNTLIKGCKNTVIPNGVTSIGNAAFHGCNGLESITIPNSVTSIEENAFNYCSDLNNIYIPNSVLSIGDGAFFICSGLTSITIPSSVASIGNLAFSNCDNLTTVIVERDTPITINSGTFSNSANATLFVPAGCKVAYEAVDNWKDFKEIDEMTDDITIGTAGMGTFCSTHPLDFSGTNDIKAYIVSAFKPSTGEVILTRITDVPANTGIVVKGDADTYTIPWGPGETIVSNMLAGVTVNTVLNKVDGDYTNYILSNKNDNLGFYAVTDGSTLSAGKAYLPLPTASLSNIAGARGVKFVFDDEQTTDIIIVGRTNTDAKNEVYDLQGRKVRKAVKGLYIVNGKKVTIQ